MFILENSGLQKGGVWGKKSPEIDVFQVGFGNEKVVKNGKIQTSKC